jgi:hypothetical protein
VTDLREPGSRAILLGASDYGGKLPDVPAVVDTLNDLRTALIERCGMDRESISDLRGRHNADQVMAAVAEEAQHTKGILLIYYVGHGLTGDGGELYLSVGDTDPDRELGRLERTAIHYRKLVHHLGKSQALAIVVILDCCFSGRALPRGAAAEHGLTMPTGQQGGLVLTSAAREEHAIARESEKYTAFSGKLLTLLNEGDRASPETITLRAACAYLKRTTENRLPRPQSMVDDTADNIVLTDNRGYMPVPETETMPQFWLSTETAEDQPRQSPPPDLPSTEPPERPRQQAPVLVLPAPPTPATTPTPAPSAIRPGNGEWVGRIRRLFENRRARVNITLLAAVLLTAMLVLLLDEPLVRNPPVAGAPSPSPSRTTTGYTLHCASGTLTLNGSAFGSIAQNATKEYHRLCKNAQFTVNFGHGEDSALGISQLKSALNDPSEAESTIAMYDGTTQDATGLTANPIGMFIYSVVAHTGLYPGSDITKGALKQLFDEPGCVPGKLAVGLQAGSATRLALLGWLKNVTSDPNIADTCSPPSGQATENTYETALATVSGTQNAISYMAVDGIVNGNLEIDGHITKSPHVSVLSIDGVTPTPENVHNNLYHFAAVENLYTGPNPSPLALSFLAYLPHYLAGNPTPDFITCSSAPKSMADDCPAPR